MIGDRLNTDILFGINGNLGTLLVLTGKLISYNIFFSKGGKHFLTSSHCFSGVTEEKDILAENARIIPDYYISSLGDITILNT